MTNPSTPDAERARIWKNDVDELCVALAISRDDLTEILSNLPRFYRIQNRTKFGKKRTFYEAQGSLLTIHIKLQKWLTHLPIHAAAHGWSKGCSVKTAVAPHAEKPCVISLDIADFFPTITPRRVINLYKREGCSPEIADILTRLTTWRGHLPQGLKTSPAIANLVMVEIDARIDTACRQLGFAYTRYGDDIMLSGRKGTKQIKSVVKSILRQTGFRVKEEKTEENKNHTQQTALKLVVNERPNLPSEKRRVLRAVAHNCLTKGIASERKPDESPEKTARRIGGQLSHWAHTNPQSARSSMAKFKQAVEAPKI